MVDSHPSDAPLEEAAGVAGPQTVDALTLLGNETRLAILLALWEAYEPHTDGNRISFTELRERVGVRDSGQFNYHLGKLEGRYLRKNDDGYGLRRTGRMLVQSIIAGAGIEEPSLESNELDATCPLCGAATEITYENVYVYQVCTQCEGWSESDDEHPTGTLLGWTFEPTGLSDRTAEEVFTASTIKNFARIVTRFEGICPMCSGPVEWSIDVCEDHDPGPDEVCPECGREDAVEARETCSVCKSSGRGSLGIKVLFHPAVISFFYEHGIEVGFTGDTDFDDVVRALELVGEMEEEVVGMDPVRIRVTISRDGDELRLTLDEEMNVIDVAEID